MATPTTPAHHTYAPHEDDFQTPIVDGALLEGHKENIAPTRDGRSATALSQIFSVPRAQRTRELANARSMYCRLLAEADEDPDPYGDPLDAYAQFVKWTVDNYPSGTSSESGLLELLDRATSKFCDDIRYKNDMRYHKLWRLYATFVEHPHRIYGFMLSKDIGTMYAAVYEEYALALERDGNHKKADQIYNLGIHRKPHGVERLQERYREFMTRMLTAKPAPDPSPPSARPAAPTLGGRTVLGTRAVSNPAPSGSSARDVFGSARPTNGRIAIFTDPQPDEGAQINDWPAVDSRAAANKENTKDAIPWKGEVLHQPGALPPRTPRIEVFREEPAASSSTAAHSSENVFQRSRKPPSEAEALVKNPFKNHAHDFGDFVVPPIIPPTTAPTTAPSSRASSPAVQPSAKSNTVASSSQPRVSPPKNSKSKVTAVPVAPAGKRPEKLQVKIDFLYRNGNEYCIQEARAAHIGLRGKSWPAPPPRDFIVPLKGDGSTAGKVRRASTKNKRAAEPMSVGSPTVTMMTRQAQSEVFGMFSGMGEELEHRSNGRMSTKVPENGPPSTPTPSSRPFTIFVNTKQSQNQNATPAPSVANKENENSRPRSVPKGRLVVAEDDSLTPKAVPREKGPLEEKKMSTKPEVVQNAKEKMFKPPSNHDIRIAKVDQPVEFYSGQPLTVEEVESLVARDHEVETAAPMTPTPSGAAGRRPFAVFTEESPAAVSQVKNTFRISVHEDPIVNPPEPKRTSPPTLRRPTSASAVFSNPFPVEEAPPDIADDEYEEQFDGDGGPDESTENYGELLNGADEFNDEDEDEDDYDPPLGGRLGHFNVMTPIAERTAEYTTSNTASTHHARSTHNHTFGTDGHETNGQDHFNENDPHSLVRPGAPAPGLTPESTSTSFASSSEPRMHAFPNIRAPSSSTTTTTTADSPSAQEDFVIVDRVPPRSSLESTSRRSSRSHLPTPTPCNHFDPAVLGPLIAQSPYLFHDFRSAQSGRLEALQKFAKKHTQGAAASNTMPLELGDQLYEIKWKVGEGGFGAVFLADHIRADDEDLDDEDDGDERPVAVKAVRPCQLWEYVVLRNIRESLPPSVLASIIQPRELFAFKDESFLVLDFCQQGTLLNCVNNATKCGVAPATAGGGIEESLVVFFTIELLKILEAMHSQGYIHGDLKIDNCLLRLDDVPGGSTAWTNAYHPSGEGGWSYKGVRLIDFGRAIDTKLFPTGQTFVGDWPTDERDCVELREGRPWTFQTDYFGLAGIIYCMLFGKYIETSLVPNQSSMPAGAKQYKVTTPLKRYWQMDLWSKLFDVLLNPSLARPDASLPLCEELAEVRCEMEGWLTANCEKSGKNLKAMLKKIERSSLE